MKKTLLILCPLVLVGCSSVSVLEQRENAALAPKAAPSVLLVRPFQVPRDAEFDAARAAANNKEEPQTRVGRLIAEGVISKAEAWIAPGQILEEEAAVPQRGLLVEGKVLRTRQGSRALRLGIGFGFGRTQLETSVRVYNLEASSKEPWLNFETTGGSNMEPGLVGLLAPSPVAIPVAASLLGGAATAGAVGGKGVTEDAKRTGRTIAAAIHDRLVERLGLKRKARLKRAGQLSTPLGDVPVPITELPEMP
jgi:hypothetical protein